MIQISRDASRFIFVCSCFLAKRGNCLGGVSTHAAPCVMERQALTTGSTMSMGSFFKLFFAEHIDKLSPGPVLSGLERSVLTNRRRATLIRRFCSGEPEAAKTFHYM